MKKGLCVIVTVGIMVVACGKKDHPQSKDEISGTYLREYAFKVINPETGAEIGMRTIRDTIFIRPIETKYEILNHKWGMNDYDNEGWKNMEHAEDRPLQTFQTTFNSANDLLHSETMPDLVLDLPKGQLFKDKGLEKPYGKVK